MTHKNVFLVVIIALISVISISSIALTRQLLGQYAGPDTLPNGLELTDFKVQNTQNPPVTSDPIFVSYKLKNVGAAPITFGSDVGVFVGARLNSTSDEGNYDFGFSQKGRVISPGQTITFQTKKVLPAGGTWRLWPAFKANGQWGPFRWHEIVINVTYVEAPPPADPNAPKTPADDSPPPCGSAPCCPNC